MKLTSDNFDVFYDDMSPDVAKEVVISLETGRQEVLEKTVEYFKLKYMSKSMKR